MARETESGLEFVLRIRWYIYLRWFLFIAITLPSLIALFFGSGLTRQRILSFTLSAIILLSNIIFYGLSRLRRSKAYFRFLAAFLLAFDIIFITYFIYTKGGIDSRSQILYALPILMSAMLFGRFGVYGAALVSALGYDAVIFGNYIGIIHSPAVVAPMPTNTTSVSTSIIYFSSILLIIGGLADFMTRLLVVKERQASATAATLKRAQAIAKVGSWEWDVVADTIIWSDELFRLFGVSKKSDIDYGTYLISIHPEDKPWAAETIERAIKNKQAFSFDHRVVLPDKTVSVIHSEGQVITDRRGKVTHLYGTAHDITAERALESAKGDFVSLASHQLRTPASGVRMLLALLRDGYSGKLTDEQQKTVEQAFDANERLLKIADDLLNVAKLESGRLVLDKRTLELHDWLQTILKPQQLLAKEKRQKLKLVLPRTPIDIQADPARLAMVIDNLLSNARKYTPERGTITVSLVVTSRNCNIVVSDTGSGMSRQEIGQLFGKFTRLDNHASKGVEGSGLGLYLAKSIVDLHRGSITVKSKVSTGSTFTVRLPRSA